MNPDLKAMLVIFILSFVWTRLCWFCMARSMKNTSPRPSPQSGEGEGNGGPR